MKINVFTSIILMSSLLCPVIAHCDILILRPNTSGFDTFISSFKKEVGSDFEIKEQVVKKDDTPDSIYKIVKQKKVRLVLLIDNLSVRKAKETLKTYPDLPPMIATMALNLNHELEGIKKIAGVGYEVSGYTIVSEMNKAIDRKIRNVKVLYRSKMFQNVINDAINQLGREKVKLHAIDIESSDLDAMNKTIERELQSLEGYDALWIILDSLLMNKNNFAHVWIKQARESKVPFLCGVEKFALPPVNLCTFAAFPNTRGLASHVAEMALSILEGEALPADYGVEYLVSSDKVLNAKSLGRFEISVANQKIDNLRIYEE